jgi:hypothetical protein
MSRDPDRVSLRPPGKQPAIASDLDCGAGLCEEVPEQNLIRRENWAADPGLQLLDCPCRAEPVLADERSFCLLSDVPRSPGVDGSGFDSARVAREFGRRRRHDVEPLTAEVGGAELVDLGVEPRRADQRDALDAEVAQCQYRRGARRRNGTSSSVDGLETMAASSSKPITYADVVEA